MTKTQRSAALALFAAGALLRILLCTANPPGNSFDDHYEPIMMIMETGEIPAKDSCFQAYNPPVFYWVSAQLGSSALALGLPKALLPKFLQFLPCLCGILALGMVWPILSLLPLPFFPRILAFGTACFLPRHIYMSAMHSNDTMSYLGMSAVIWLLLLLVWKGFVTGRLMALGGILSATLFTKYTALAALPAIALSFASAIRHRLLSPGRILRSVGLVFLLPVILLFLYGTSNVRRYGSPLPHNTALLDPGLLQPRDVPAVEFWSFKPWECVQHRILVPGAIHSYWTLLYWGMWCDDEPKFLYYLDPNHAWWDRYGLWLHGSRDTPLPYPGENPSVSWMTKAEGSGLSLLGVAPLGLMLLGLFLHLSRRWENPAGRGLRDAEAWSAMTFFLASGLAVSVALVLKLPVYCSMKPSYLLGMLPAMAAFMALGATFCERFPLFRRLATLLFGALFLLSAVHVIHICGALHWVQLTGG